ncbi:MAG: redoxin domain-containing protein [Bacteroidota bacterium]
MRYLIFLSILFFSFTSQAKDSTTVFLFLSEDCPICRYYTLELNQMYEDYKDKGIGMVGMFPNRSSTERKIKEFKEKYKLAFPLKREYLQHVSREFGVRVTPEVVVYDEGEKKVIYKGRIDNTYAALGKRRAKPSQREMRKVLDAIVNDQPIIPSETTSVGCFITFID